MLLFKLHNLFVTLNCRILLYISPVKKRRKISQKHGSNTDRFNWEYIRDENWFIPMFWCNNEANTQVPTVRFLFHVLLSERSLETDQKRRKLLKTSSHNRNIVQMFYHTKRSIPFYGYGITGNVFSQYVRLPRFVLINDPRTSEQLHYSLAFFLYANPSHFT